jgi:antitoxin component HigA of HigAB toxin-antitoxin module
MNGEQIVADGDYRLVLAEIERLMTVERDVPEGDRLEFLVTLVEAWEAQHYSVRWTHSPLEFAALMNFTGAASGRESPQDLQSEHRSRPQPRERQRC